MRPVRLTVSSQTTSGLVSIDAFRFPATAVAVNMTGTLTYSVQVTFDDIFSNTFTPGSANWIDMTNMSAKSASAYALLDIPCTALRLNVTAYTSGSATITVIQSGPDGS